MTVRISQQQLESYLWGAATLLRGTIDAGDYKQFIFPLLFYKRLCDVYDEETQTALTESEGDEEFASYPENHRFQIPPEAHWKETRKVAKNVGTALQNAMRAIETANPDKLYGIFGDAQWTNKDRLSDAMLRDLIEHFSSLELTIANLPEDELGNGYEYLIKKFADDAGHTAAEFYTNRTVVHLMTELLQPQPNESIYDPTCGSGGMLLSCIAQLRKQGKEWRNVRLYGQERNLMTSSIARMNCFLHGIEDFRIERGDTLVEPKFVQGDHLQRFDVVLANPPYSIKQWDREAFASDPWGRNLYGTPPQGRADYAFWQHIILSMNPKSGRCAILFPHGILFRKEEAEMRRKLIEADLIECIIGLGSNLFYNSAMEACIVICRMTKVKARRGQILLINAVNEVTRERAQSYLTDHHIERIVKAYEQFNNEPGFAYVASQENIRKNDNNLNVLLYVDGIDTHNSKQKIAEEQLELKFVSFLESAQSVRESLSRLVTVNRTIGMSPIDISADLHSPTWLKSSNWKTVRLGDVAVRDAKTIKPDEKVVYRWVAGEHIDEGDIHVRRWSDTTNPLFPPTFRFTFKAGHVLIHSRNPNKVVIPDFDGITGEKLFVLKSRDTSILRTDFLAFVLTSNSFKVWVNKWLSGSVNRFLNWSALEKFEFALPPLDQQCRIADALLAMDDALERYLNFRNATEQVHSSYDQELWSNKHLLSVRLADLCIKVQDGTHFSPKSTNGQFRYVTSKNIRNGYLDFSECSYVSAEDHAHIYMRADVKNGDVLLTKDGANTGNCALFNLDEEVSLLSSVAFIRTDPDKLDARYLIAYLKSRYGYSQIRRQMKGTAITRITLKQIRDIPIPILTLEEQRSAAERMIALDELESSINHEIMVLRNLIRIVLEKGVWTS